MRGEFVQGGEGGRGKREYGDVCMTGRGEVTRRTRRSDKGET